MKKKKFYRLMRKQLSILERVIRLWEASAEQDTADDSEPSGQILVPSIHNKIETIKQDSDLRHYR